MTTTRTAQPTYRQTKTGEWVVCGPASIVRPGCHVNVSRKDGTVKVELIERVGREFDGMVYGYIARSASKLAPAGRNRTFAPTASRCQTGGDCWSFHAIKHCHECGK